METTTQRLTVGSIGDLVEHYQDVTRILGAIIGRMTNQDAMPEDYTKVTPDTVGIPKRLSQEDIEDVIHDTFAYLYKHQRMALNRAKTYDGNLLPFAITVAKGYAKNALRLARRRDISYDAWVQHHDIEDILSCMEGTLSRLEYDEQLYGRVAQVVNLTVSGYTQEEIAKILRVRARTVRRDLGQAKKILGPALV